MASTEGFVDFGRAFNVPEVTQPLTTVPAPTLKPVLTKENSTSNPDEVALLNAIKWSTGVVASLAVVLNIFVISLLHKGNLLKKDPRLVYHMFMAIGGTCFSASTATNSLYFLICKTNLFPTFGSCLMVQATAMGSFHMIGLSVALLTYDLYSQLASLPSTRPTLKISGGVIKCIFCYVFVIVACYLPFFWMDNPVEVKTCSISAIYGHHVHMANYLGIANFSIMTILIVVMNGMLLKAINLRQWRSKLRIQTYQVPCYISDQPPEGTETSVRRTTAETYLEETAAQETSFADRSGQNGESREAKYLRVPDHSPKPASFDRKTSMSTDTQLTYAESMKDTSCVCSVEILNEPSRENDNEYTKSTSLIDEKIVSEAPPTLADLDTFFVSRQSLESEKSSQIPLRNRSLRESVILSAASLSAAKANVSRESGSFDEIIDIENTATVASERVRMSSDRRPSERNADESCILCWLCKGNFSRGPRHRPGKATETDSNLSVESIKKRHGQNREAEIRKFLTAVKIEITLGLSYFFCTLPSFIWNIERLLCASSCSLNQNSHRSGYHLGMTILSLIIPIIIFLACKKQRNFY